MGAIDTRIPRRNRINLKPDDEAEIRKRRRRKK
jgi:hypothetical protein